MGKLKVIPTNQSYKSKQKLHFFFFKTLTACVSMKTMISFRSKTAQFSYK